MRLIDLDTEVFVPIYDEERNITYEEIMTIEDFFHKFMSDYDPPIIEAIPIEWLNNKLMMARKTNDEKLIPHIQNVLLLWMRHTD